jgi:hypothetical protein
MNVTPNLAHHEIAKRALEIWERSGRPGGQETEHWLRAEHELQTAQVQADEFAQSLGEHPRGKQD